MKIRFAEAANNELNDACDWFERQQSGLGVRFKNDVREATLRIAGSPLLFPVEMLEVRRYVMNRFSYGTADLFVFPAKAGNQRLYLTGFPPTRERQNRINQRFPIRCDMC